MQSQPDVEQVGFIESANDPAAQGRLQMMGGEFCGNAASAFFYILSRQHHIQQAMIEVSGKTAPLQAAMIGEKIELNLSEKITIVDPVASGSTALVEMEGITHLLCEMPAPEDKEAYAREQLLVNHLLDCPAAGVIFFDRTGPETRITPVVWVKATRSLVSESACASGTMALAVWMNQQHDNQGQAIHVSQPGGAVITVRSKHGQNGQIDIIMQSRVSVLEEAEIQIVLEP